jgi:hypothetical protein
MDLSTTAVVLAGLKYVGPHAGKAITDFTAAVFMPSGQALGQVLAHPIVEWQKRRAARAEALIREAAVQLHGAGVEPQAVPGPVLMPLLESGSLEEDAGMRRKWAALLANAAGGDYSVPPGFVSIMADLSPLEARVLDRAYEQASITKFADIPIDALLEDLELEEDESAAIVIENIERLGLWRRKLQTISHLQIKNALQQPTIVGTPPAGWAESTRFNNLGEEIVVDDNTGYYQFTALGCAFVKACAPPNEKTESPGA